MSIVVYHIAGTVADAFVSDEWWLVLLL